MNDSFCIAPWVHTHVEPTGVVTPCCLITDPKYSYGSLNKNSLEEIWNSDEIKSMRLDMLNGVRRPECAECHVCESLNQSSYRKELNEEFSHHLNFVNQTGEDGSVDKFNVIYWDFRFSNVCNFKCRTCYEGNSSSWAKENNKSPIIIGIDDELCEDLYPIVEKIYFAGGEPLIMDSHYKVLDKLIEYKRFDVKLIYTTNFSTLYYKDKCVLDYWERFPNLTVSASMDSLGKRGELIRDGLNWNTFIDNVSIFHERFPDRSKQFGIICTLQILNSFDSIDLHKKLYEDGIIKSLDNFQLNFLFEPSYLSVNCLPNTVKIDLIKKIKDHIQNYLKPRDADISHFVSYAKFLTEESKTDELEDFVREIKYIDTIRNQDTRKTFPEFEESIWRKY